jgi:hypothetical protein
MVFDGLAETNQIFYTIHRRPRVLYDLRTSPSRTRWNGDLPWSRRHTGSNGYGWSASGFPEPRAASVVRERGSFRGRRVILALIRKKS